MIREEADGSDGKRLQGEGEDGTTGKELRTPSLPVLSRSSFPAPRRSLRNPVSLEPFSPDSSLPAEGT